jgi:hypothetical protein
MEATKQARVNWTSARNEPATHMPSYRILDSVEKRADKVEDPRQNQQLQIKARSGLNLVGSAAVI